MDRNEAIRLLRSGKKGIAEWNRRRGAVPLPESSPHMLPEIDLSEVDLGGTDLSGALLVRTILAGAKFINCNLVNASLSGAILNGADFSKANLADAIIGSTMLVDTTFSGACLCKASINQSVCIRTKFAEANLEGANLQATALVQVNFANANLNNTQVYGIAAWDVNLTGATESDLVISLPNEPVITVDNLEVAQFVYLLLNNDKIRGVIDTLTSKVVLILGRFTPQRKNVLDAIREELRNRNYCPVIFDFDKPASRDTQETVTTLARLAHFVIADITDPMSIPQELVTIVETLPSVPIQPILQQGSAPWGMYDHINRYPWVLPVYEYANATELLASVGDKVISPGELKVAEQKCT